MLKEQLKSKISLLLIVQFCFLLTSQGQEGIKAVITKHNLQSFTARSGFQKLFIDHKGLMYIASSEGIILYNGITEQFIKNSEAAGIHGVTSMVEDQQGILWVACEDGELFKIYNKELTRWLPQEGLPKHKISKLVVDHSNQLWIATKGEGVYVYNQKYLYHFGPEDGLIYSDVNDMVYSDRLGIIVSSDKGIQNINFIKDAKQTKQVKLDCIGNQDIIQNMKLFGENLYIDNLSTGILEWNLQKNSCKMIWDNKNAETILAFRISTEFQVVLTDVAIYVKSNELSGFVPFNNKIEFSEIQSIFLDAKNTLWLLHKSKGLLSINLPISQYEVPGRTIQDIALSQDGNRLLLCTDSGLKMIDVKSGKVIRSQFANENLTTIYPEPDNDVFWIGTYGGGLIRFNLNTGEVTRYKQSDGLPDNNILQVTGNHHYIWVTTLAGVMRIYVVHDERKLNNIKTFTGDNGLPTNFIYQIVPEPSDRIWIGTDGKGINYIDKDDPCVYLLDNSIRNHSIYNLDYSSNGLLYFNASREGLGYYDIKRDSLIWIEAPVKNLESDCISLINDSVLLTAGAGFLMLINPKEKLSITMDEEFGLTEMVPSLNAIYRDKNDNTWIGCKNAVIKVQPTILTVLNQPQNSFSNIKVLNQFVRLGIDSVFEYNHNQIAFEFNAIHYLASDHLDYRYFLKGYDKEWIYSKEGNESYSNLSPGTYQFIVQSSINKYFDGRNQIVFSFEVRKPFWQTWWFFGLLIITGVTLVRFFIRSRESAKAKEDEIKRKTSALEFEVLKSQVNPHFLFNSFNSVISLIEDDKEKAIEFTEKLSDYFRNILKYRDEHLILLDEEVTILMNYFDLLKLRHPDQILLEKGLIQSNAWIAPMTLQLLMENAIKHNEVTPHSPLKIWVYCDAGFLVFRNSIMRKRSNVDSTGFGLESIRLRYQLLTDKEIRIEESDEKFSVEIPLIYK